MKYVQIEFPDNSLHNVFINGYYYNEKLDKKIIDYYDLTSRNKSMYAVIKNYKGKLYQDPYDLDNTYEEIKNNSVELSLKNIPNIINFLPEKQKEEINKLKEHTKTFEVYKNSVTNKYFVQEIICRIYDVGKGYHYIDKKLYREVTINEIEKIKVLSQKEKELMSPVFKELKLNKEFKKFNIYRDKDSKKIYIPEEDANNNNVGKGIHYINNEKYKEISKSEIEKIINDTTNKDYYLIPEYNELSFKIKTKILKIYYNNNSNKYLISEKEANKYEVGNGYHYIDKIKYKEVKIEELEEIYNKAYELGEYLVPVFTLLKVNDSLNHLLVYIDEVTYKCYIEKDICTKYKVGRGFKKIRGSRFMEVSAYEIQKIENESQEEPKHLKAKFEPIKIEKVFNFIENIEDKEETPTESDEPEYIMSFKVYKDNTNNKRYIDTFIYEMFFGKINKNKLKKFNNKNVIEVNEGSIRKIEEKSTTPKLEHKTEDLVIDNNKKKQIKVYKDKNNNNRLFVSTDTYKEISNNESNFKYINNQECLEISIDELTKLNENKNNDIQIKTVYLTKQIYNINNNNQQEKIEVFIARSDNEVYIPRTLAEVYKINWQREIGIENKIYVEVTEDVIRMVQEINNQIDNPFIFKTIKIKLVNKANNA